MEKRGQEFSITTLVVIVLAIIVLVVLALGFGAGWGNLWSKITGYAAPVNVDSVKQACVYACSTSAQYDYCERVRDIAYLGADNKKVTAKVTCKSWAQNQNATDASLAPGIQNILEACDAITCPQSPPKVPLNSSE